jgi:hypothetical protein
MIKLMFFQKCEINANIQESVTVVYHINRRKSENMIA